MPLFTNLTDAEVDAMYAYLQTVPVIDNAIEPGAVVK
jgi:mono/diheme cytochrome c family protein